MAKENTNKSGASKKAKADIKNLQQERANNRMAMEQTVGSLERYSALVQKDSELVSKIVKKRGEEVLVAKDLASIYDDIFRTQQNQTNITEQFYGVQNKLAGKLQLSAGFAAEIATKNRESGELTLAEHNTLKRTMSDQGQLNRLKVAAVKEAQRLNNFNKENIPYYDKIQRIQAEIKELTRTVGDNVKGENAHRLKILNTMVKEYETLGKLEKKNDRIEKMQKSVKDLMTMQGTAAGQIFNTIKDIITNPLLIFTGLLALGVQRFETMRQRGNELAEELDRVNQKLAGSGPYQDAIITRARKIHSVFRAAGEGFSSSLESAVDAVQALETQLGGINHVTSALVGTMTDLKLSINLSDDEVAKVIDTYLTVDMLSEKAAINSAEMLYSMSEQAGLNPAETFREIANATGETLAHFKGGGLELNKAVISAKRMGLGLEDVAKISKGLLNFETSIEAEMEAQMLTGMNINFNKARMFAMNKQGAKAAEEVMRQVGGLERFRRMNIFQQEAIAKATGLSVTELLKSNAQREREATIAKEKQQIHKDTVKMLPVVTSVMGKLDTGLGIIEKISAILGDLVLDVFGVDFAKAEELILSFVKSDTFTTGLKNVLFFMKGIIEGIKDSISWIWDMMKSTGIGDYLKDQDMSGGYGGSQKAGNFVGKVVAAGYIAHKVLGMTPLTAMWVRSASGAMKGLGKGIFNGIKGLFGGGGAAAGGAGGALGGGTSAAGIPYGAFGGTAGTGVPGATGGGATAAGLSGGQMMGYGIAAAFVAKGAYDVISHDKSQSSGEMAGAVGGLVGAIGGAKIGMMIGAFGGPIGVAVGAAIGAGVGYFGGQLVKNVEWFQDDLDKARIALVKSESELSLKKTASNNKLMLAQTEAQNVVRTSYAKLGLATDGVTDNELEAFAKAQLDAGNITKKQYKAAVAKTLDPLELLKLASIGAAGQLGLEEKVRQEWVENQFTAAEMANYSQMQLSKTMLEVLKTVDADSVNEKIDPKYLKTLKGKYKPSKNIAGDILVSDHDKEAIVQELYKQHGGAVSMPEIRKAAENLHNVNTWSVTRQGAFEQGVADLNLLLQKGVKTKLALEQKAYYQSQLKYQNQLDKMTYNKTTGALEVTMEKPVFDEDGNPILAAGGVLQGPSHAGGGIKTMFGEMEGGEAIINKKSTAQHLGLLSAINESGGGKSLTGPGAGSTEKNTSGALAMALWGLAENIAIDTTGSLGLEAYQAEIGGPSENSKESGAAYALDIAATGASVIGLAGLASSVIGVTSATSALASYSMLGPWGTALGLAVLAAQAIHSWYVNRHKNSQGELANNGGLTDNEHYTMMHDLWMMKETDTSLVKYRQDHGQTMIDPNTGKYYTHQDLHQVSSKGQLALMKHGRDGDMALSPDIYASIYSKLNEKPLGTLSRQNHKHAYVPQNWDIKHENTYAPDDQSYKRGPDGEEGFWFDKHGPKHQNLALKKILRMVGKKPEDYVMNPSANARDRAVSAPQDYSGYGYTDPYGYGPIAGSKGYRFEEDATGRTHMKGLGTQDTKTHKNYSYSGDNMEDIIGMFKKKRDGLYSGRKQVSLVDDTKNATMLKAQAAFVLNEKQTALDRSIRGGYNSGVNTSGAFASDQTQTQFQGSIPVITGDTYGQGGVTPSAPVSTNQNQHFRDIPIKKVNDMILTSDGQMIEPHSDDNIIMKKGEISQTAGGEGGGSNNEMINLLRELIIINKNAKVQLNGKALARAVDTANYLA